jgi:predicted ribosomally synthesized peptide with SipW-like signal peptide
MHRILLSLAAIVFAGGLVAGGTGAFFSDSETSTANVFTAGAIDLMVDSEQHYNNAVCVLNTNTTDISNDYWWQLEVGQVATVPQYPVIGSPCDGTWLPANLGAEKFFNFTDIKPGDTGENTISLHVDNNDAYACVDVDITKNDDVSTVDPETDAGDAAEDNGNPLDGELAQNINFFAWADTGATLGWQGKDGTEGGDVGEGDNKWQANEIPLFTNGNGPASDALNGKTYTLANAATGPLAGGSTSYIGLAWCAGTMNTSVPGTITCDGAGMGNIAQTDSMEAKIAFRVEQFRNNPNFTCVRPTLQ